MYKIIVNEINFFPTLSYFNMVSWEVTFLSNSWLIFGSSENYDTWSCDKFGFVDDTLPRLVAPALDVAAWNKYIFYGDMDFLIPFLKNFMMVLLMQTLPRLYGLIF